MHRNRYSGLGVDGTAAGVGESPLGIANDKACGVGLGGMSLGVASCSPGIEKWLLSCTIRSARKRSRICSCAVRHCLTGSGGNSHHLGGIPGGGHLRSLVAPSVVGLLLLLPFVKDHLDAGLAAGPPMAFLLEYANYSVFPSALSVKYLILHTAFPLFVFLCFLKRDFSLEARSRAFLNSLAFSAILLTALSAGVYINTGLAKFILASASRYVVFPAYVILALALIQVMHDERPWRRRLVILGFSAIVFFHAEKYIVLKSSNLLRGDRTHAAAQRGPANEDADRNDFRDLCLWVSRNTDIDSVFLIPPDKASFRIMAQRAVVVVRKDGGNVKYGGALARVWRRRFRKVKAAYEAGALVGLERVAEEYGAEFIVAPIDDVRPVAHVLQRSGRWALIRTGQGVDRVE